MEDFTQMASQTDFHVVEMHFLSYKNLTSFHKSVQEKVFFLKTKNDEKILI